jgi:hypothetical protein
MILRKKVVLGDGSSRPHRRVGAATSDNININGYGRIEYDDDDETDGNNNHFYWVLKADSAAGFT